MIIALGILILVTAGPLRAETGSAAAEPPAPPLNFDLKDQFDREYTQALCAGKIAIVVIADREGSKFSGPWSEAVGRDLRAAAAPATQWVPVATLPAVPGFMRGFIKGKFPQKPEQWTLLDWGGSLAKAYGLAGKRCHVLVFGSDGRLLHHSGGREVDAAAVTAIVAAVVSSKP
jgi:subtilisin family serine protease